MPSLYIFSSKFINLTCLNPFQAQMYLMTINLQLDGLPHSRHTCINPKMILNLNFIVLKEGEICLFGSSVTSTILVKKNTHWQTKQWHMESKALWLNTGNCFFHALKQWRVFKLFTHLSVLLIGTYLLQHHRLASTVLCCADTTPCLWYWKSSLWKLD